MTINFHLQEKRIDSEFINHDTVEIYHGKKQDFKDGNVVFQEPISYGLYYRIKGEISKPNFTKTEFIFEKEYVTEKFPGIYLNI